MNDYMIEGRNPVLEAIQSGRDINKLMIASGNKEGSIKKIIAQAKEKGIVISYVDRHKINSLSQSDNHQGVIAFVAAYDYMPLDQMIASIKEKGEVPFIIVLDEINDPHNLGSIMRTADAVGAHGIVIPKRRAVGLTPVVAKTSAGAIEYVPVARVTNLARAIDELKEHNIWVAGADMAGEQTHFQANFTGGIALVMGNEGKGLSRLVKEKCDFLVNIPMIGKVSSLNASVAASVIMYEIFKQRQANEQ
ncbi:23S rRNA (guanosine(2251)-2'-O)-methyltransferase RlmB [Acidaminobacter sp. JC074]|uniref:23S rRNA (guanosine(2251)-2'-O)-methyltransferase RlmB n=1 Tax=Acidaminobacter sp. JC074 TaxID=2530199 RepID=UPI001F0FCFE4|nr:23S rRNA (guanosine(2251)-2'-O)-methyltransferase RlmB [Acidaminobacter sp. JC074]MCH4890465.1 23S rRNA (guanosine(2251)-2'-O)-methyltransferase RlmB [Acidaminobacter sp. JC074]